MNQELYTTLNALHRRFNRNAALVGGFGLLGLCWILAFVLENDLCIVAAALCALFCMHVANKEQIWRDARVAADLGVYREGLVSTHITPRGEEYQCHATVQVFGSGTWEYRNIGQTIPNANPEPCRCYFKPGIEWPVLIVSADNFVIAENVPRAMDGSHQHSQSSVQVC